MSIKTSILSVSFVLFSALISALMLSHADEETQTDWPDKTLAFMRTVIDENDASYFSQKAKFETELVKKDINTQMRYWKSQAFNSAAYAPTVTEEYNRAKAMIQKLDNLQPNSDHSVFIKAMDVVKETIGNSEIDEGILQINALLKTEDLDISDKLRIEIAKANIYDYNLSADNSASTLTEVIAQSEIADIDPVVKIDILKAKTLIFHFSHDPESILKDAIQQYELSGKSDLLVERFSVLNMVTSLLLSHGAYEQALEAVDILLQNLDPPQYIFQEYYSYQLCSYINLFSGRNERKAGNDELAKKRLEAALNCSLKAEPFLPVQSEVAIFDWTNILIATAFDLDRLDIVRDYLPKMKNLRISSDNFNNKTEVITIEAKLFRAEGKYDDAFDKMREALNTLYAEKQDQIARNVERQTRLIESEKERITLEADLLERANKSQKESIHRLYWLLGLICFFLIVTAIFAFFLLATRRAAIASRDKARKLSEVKSRFLANMSHEVRTPMSGVLGLTSALEQTPLTKEQNELVVLIAQSGAYMVNILDDILDFAQIDRDNITIRIDAFSPNELLSSTYAFFQKNTHEAGLELILDSKFQNELVTLGDEKRIRQILFNLISNAIKFTPNGQITLRAWCTQSDQVDTQCELHFEVSDTGIGMDEKQMENIFDPFAQVDMTKRRRYGGLGLGLSICKQLLDAMGGAISVTSIPGSGTNFSFYVPVDVQTSQKSQPAEIISQEISSEENPLRVMVVEDHPMNRRVISILLSSLGIQPVIFEGGRQAINAYETETFDTILIDIQMPDIDGIQTMHAMRKIDEGQGRTSPRYIAFTANAMVHQIEEYRATGFDDILTKPIEAKDLVKILNIE